MSAHLFLFTMFVYVCVITFWKFPYCACSQVIISKKMGMVALLSSSSGIKVISRMGPTMPGMKLILWLPERHTYAAGGKTGEIRQFLTPLVMLTPCSDLPSGQLRRTLTSKTSRFKKCFPLALKTLNFASYLQNIFLYLYFLSNTVCFTLLATFSIENKSHWLKVVFTFAAFKEKWREGEETHVISHLPKQPQANTAGKHMILPDLKTLHFIT